MKAHFKIAFVCIVLTLFNCQKDDVVNQQTKQNEQNSGFITSKVDASQIERNTNLTKQLNSIKSKLKDEKADMQSKSVYSSTYDFIVDTDFATYIESQDSIYHSYTFPVYRTFETNLVENLLLTLQDDGTYGVVLMAYDLTAQEKEDLALGIQPNYEGKIATTVLEDFNTEALFSKFTTVDCVTAVYSYCNSTYNHPEGFFEDGTKCNAYTEQVVSYCSGGAGDGYTYYSGEVSNLNEEGDSSAGSGGVNSGNVATQPFYSPQPWQAIAKCVVFSLDNADGLTYLMNNKPIAKEIENFLDDNCTNESQEFSLEIVDAGVNNSLLTPFPFLQYPESEAENYKRDYPKFTNFLKNEIVDIKNDQNVIDALTQIGIITEEQIIEHLTWDKGPIVRLTDLGPTDNILGRYNPTPLGTTGASYGPNVIEINSRFAALFEQDAISDNPQYDLKAFKFFIAIVVLHEITHYADFHYTGNAFFEDNIETGELFEANVFYNLIVEGEGFEVTIGNFNETIQKYFLIKN